MSLTFLCVPVSPNWSLVFQQDQDKPAAAAEVAMEDMDTWVLPENTGRWGGMNMIIHWAFAAVFGDTT